jgi:hypothetical protein
MPGIGGGGGGGGGGMMEVPTYLAGRLAIQRKTWILLTHQSN